MAFKYKRPSQEAMEKHATQQGGNFTSFIKDEYRTFTPRKGDNAVRILPRDESEGAEHYTEEVWVHYSVGPDNGSVLCMLKMTGEPCAICEEAVRLQRRDDEAAAELKPGRRCLSWIIDRKNEEQGPMLWSMAWTVDRDISKQAKDRETGRYYFIDDPEQGYDVYFDRDGEGLTTKYSGFQLSRRPSSVDPKYLEYVANNPLLDTLVIRSYDEVKRIFEGGGAPSKEEKASPPTEDRRPPPQEEKEEPPFDGGKTREPPPEEKEAEREPPPKTPPQPAREPEPVGASAPVSGAERAAALRARFAKK